LTGPTATSRPGLLASEGVEALGLFGAVGAQDQVDEGGFFGLELFLLLGFTQVGVHADVMLAARTYPG